MLPREDSSVIVYEFPVENVNAPPVLMQLQAEDIRSWACPSVVGVIEGGPVQVDFAYWLEFKFFT